MDIMGKMKAQQQEKTEAIKEAKEAAECQELGLDYNDALIAFNLINCRRTTNRKMKWNIHYSRLEIAVKA